MPQNVLVSVLGEGKYLTALVRAILEKNIIPTRFLFLSAKNEASLQAAEGYDVTVCEDELSAVLKSEIVLVIVSVCDSDKVDLAYLSERIVAATELMAAVLHRDEDGRLSASYEASKLARPFLCKPARDIVDTMCEMLNEEG